MASKTKQIEARRANVAILVMAGASHREIRDRLGVSLGTVNNDIKALRKEWAQAQEDAEFQCSLDLKRLDELLGSVWAAASRGHIQSVEAVLKVIDRRAKMLGYDALDNELTRQLKQRNPQGEVEELDDAALMQIAAGVRR